MHEKFVDWLRPTTFSHDRQTIELRWQGTEAAIESLDSRMGFELVRLVFGRELESPENLDKFRQNFKSVDETFSTSGNDHELQVLAGCVLAIICTDETSDRHEVPMAILTASACGKRVPVVEIDLIGMAAEWLKQGGIKARSRSSISEPGVFTSKNAFDAVIAEFEANSGGQGMPAAVVAFRKVASAIENLSSTVQKRTHESITEINRLLKIQDEELQMLWWMVGGWSAMWETPFAKIDIKSRPILLAKETAEITDLPSEPPSLQSVLYRIGIDPKKKSAIPEAVSACGEYLKELAPRSIPCPTIYPLHFAISRALETGGDKTWIPNWSKVSGIQEKEQISSLGLALQMYREIKLMEFEDYNE